MTTSIDTLLDIMAKLRDPEEGCPWDRQQTFATIVPYTIEEAYEVADAIEREDMIELREELGDLLFQVVFYTQMAKEAGHFEFADVVTSISDKMLRRHPHVFADASIGSAADQHEAWERHKKQERASTSHTGLLAGVAAALPALIRAEKLQKRAAKIGFDWPDVSGPLAKVREEVEEFEEEIKSTAETSRLSEELGDLLFSCVNLARHAGIEAETALRMANKKFERRFAYIEQSLTEQEKDIHEVSLEEMDSYWEKAKRHILD